MKVKFYTHYTLVKISATLSASIILFFGVLSPVLFWAMLFTVDEPLISDKENVDRAIVLLVCLGIINIALGRAVALLILYLFPPYLRGHRNLKLIKVLIVFSVVWIGMAFLAACQNFHFLNFLFFFLLNLIWLLGFSYPVLKNHTDPESFLKKPFNLFLRRFSTFGDQIINEAVLKLSNFNIPIAFLTITKTKAGDWSPTKFFRGLINMPLLRRCQNEQWKIVAQELIAKAELIIIDLSESSESMTQEIRMIDNSERWKDTILLISSQNSNSDTKERIQYFKNNGSDIIIYKTDWGESLDRIAFGCIAIITISTVIFLVVGVAIIKLISIFKHVQYEVISDKAGNSPFFFWGVALFAVVTISNSMIFFLKPGLDAKSKNLLNKAIQKKRNYRG